MGSQRVGHAEATWLAAGTQAKQGSREGVKAGAVKGRGPSLSGQLKVRRQWRQSVSTSGARCSLHVLGLENTSQKLLGPRNGSWAQCSHWPVCVD